MTPSLDAPVATVTGSASGIGLAATKLLVSRGYRVMMADWNYEKCAEESAALGLYTHAMKCDVSSWENQLEVFEKTVDLWGKMDLVGANAGLPEQVPLLFETGDVHTKPTTVVVDVDLVGVIYSVNLALHNFRMNGGKGGKIIITSSQVGIHAFPTGPIYGAAKAGVRPFVLFLLYHMKNANLACSCIHLVRSMADRLAEEKIYMNTFCPGLTISAITELGSSVFPKHIITPMENHMRAWTEFIDNNLHGYVYEVDAGGLYNRTAPEYWSLEHQSWLGSPETQDIRKKVGTLGAAEVEK